MKVTVWIDQNLCTGDGLCEEICPEIFGASDDGLYYVKEVEWPDLSNGSGNSNPSYKMKAGMATVPDKLRNAVIEAAEGCPGECIFLETLDG